LVGVVSGHDTAGGRAGDRAARLVVGEAVRIAAADRRGRHEAGAHRHGVGEADTLGVGGTVVGQRDGVGGVGAGGDRGRVALGDDQIGHGDDVAVDREGHVGGGVGVVVGGAGANVGGV